MVRYGRSRSFKVTEISTNRKPIRKCLYSVVSETTYCSKISVFAVLSLQSCLKSSQEGSLVTYVTKFGLKS